MEFDIRITGGTIVDGSGRPGVRGDVGIRDGRIVALGAADGPAADTIDAAGRIVAPGFIDIHTHYDFQILWDRMLSISPWHGVTTVVMGNCGFGIAPTRPGHRALMTGTMESVEGMDAAALRRGVGDDWAFETFPEYLDAIERRGAAINVGVLIGHTPVRLYVMGEDAAERAATADEIATMKRIVRDGLDAGALGFATSKSGQHVGYHGKPVPSRLAGIDEIGALAGALGEAGTGLMMATIGPGFFFREFAAIAAETGRPICWSALLAGMKGPGSHRSMLERARAQQADGLAITPQVSCRPIRFEFTLAEPFLMDSLKSFRTVAAAGFDDRMRIYADAGFRDRVNSEIGGGLPPFDSPWHESVISHSPAEPGLEGRRICDVAGERGIDPLAAMLDIAIASGLAARFRMAVVNTDEADVEELIGDPATVLGLSDAGAHAGQLCDACFPTDLLGRWVRDKGALGIEQAVRMLTARPAEIYGLSDRGLLAEGRPADVVVFDPDTVAAGDLRRVADFPAGAERLVSDAAGIDAVICNGVAIRRGGADCIDAAGPLPGRLLRGGTAS